MLHSFSSRGGRYLAATALMIGLNAGVAPSVCASPFAGGVVTLVTSTSTGSSFDIAARALAEPLSKAWGIPVVVDNRPGASTIIASNLVAKATPDGRTLLLAVTPTIQAPFLFTTASIDPTKAFRPIAQIFDARLWFAINSSAGADSVASFLEIARKKKDFSYSTPGAGSTPHLNAIQLTRQANVEMLHVPYRGVSPAVIDLVGGRVTSTFASYSDLSPHVASGNIKILASTGDGRSPLTPQVPSMKEAGYTGFDVIGFGGIVAPAGTSNELVNQISRDIHEAMANPKLQERLFHLGLEPVKNSNPAEFGEVIQKQSAYWKKVILDAGVKAE